LKVITDEGCCQYEQPGHPERPQRVSGTLLRLRAQQRLPIQWAEPGECSDAQILRAHFPYLLKGLEAGQPFDEDTPCHEGIGRFARRSAGAALAAARAAQEEGGAFSLMRPPGHHALRGRPMGFCYLNNMAIAVLDALARGAGPVAVLDFDVHHGNGTEAILLNEPGTSFYSIHQAPCYPGTGTRNVGKNCYNFPLPPRTPRAEYRQSFQSALEHLAAGKPGIIGVSAGFDAYARDPLAEMTLEAEDYHWMGAQLRALGIPAFSLLEGGYSDDLPELVLAYLCGLQGV